MGFNIASTANGSTIKNLSAWGNYHKRVDGPGKFIDGNGMQNVTVDNIWVEHFVCLYWGVNSSNNTFKNLRIRNTAITEFAFTPKRHMLVGFNAIPHLDAPAYRDCVTYT